MPVFLMMAGMAMSKSRKTNHNQVFIARVISYTWLYIVWTSIYLIPSVVALLRGRVDLPTWLQAAITSYASPSGTLWYVYYLVIFISSAIFINEKYKIYAILGALVGQASAHYAGLGKISQFFYLLLFFFAGYFYRNKLTGFFERFSPIKLLVSVGVYTVLDVFVITWSSNYRGHDSSPFVLDLMTGLGIVWFVQIAHILSLTNLSKLLQRVGSHTMPIYLIHIPLIMIMYQLCRLVLGHLDIIIASKYASWLFGLLSVHVSMLLFKPLKRISGLFAPPRWLIKLTSRERQHTLRARSTTAST